MSKVVKKRSWGKTTRRSEKIIVISREKIEEILNFDDECRENKLVSQRKHEKNETVFPEAMDLQQPELMTNERLIEALKRIKVPIPVYSDGKPSRERLLYLYKTNVLPQPQRNKQHWRRRRRRRNELEEDVGGVEEWLCGQHGVKVVVNEGRDDWSTNSVGGSTALLKKKCEPPLEVSEGYLVPPAKRLLLDSLSTEAIAHSPTITIVPRVPSSSGVPPCSGISAITSKLSAVSSGGGHSIRGVITVTQPLTIGSALVGVTSSNLVAKPSAGAKTNKNKITWP